MSKINKLLIVTQRVDRTDENLGFFHGWISEFSKQCQEVTVITSFLGKINLPENIKIYSLGKESGSSKISRIIKFWLYFYKNYRNSDAIFFHMIPEFVIAASPFFLFSRRPSALWYVHKSVTPKLKLAEKLVDFVFTASSLSFRLPSKKVIYTGHAIDTEAFRPVPRHFVPGSRPTEVGLGTNSKAIRILTVGRISPVKGLETMIRAFSILKSGWNREWVLNIIGGPLMPRDHQYFEKIKNFIHENGLENRVFLTGPRPFTEIPGIYGEHDIFISMSGTGSIDKAVLEAMSAGLTVLSANEAFKDYLPAPYFLEHRAPELLAARIRALADESRPNMKLRSVVEKHHSLSSTVGKIISYLGRA